MLALNLVHLDAALLPTAYMPYIPQLEVDAAPMFAIISV
jgi:hypothetical protein